MKTYFLCFYIKIFHILRIVKRHAGWGWWMKKQRGREERREWNKKERFHYNAWNVVVYFSINTGTILCTCYAAGLLPHHLQISKSIDN